MRESELKIMFPTEKLDALRFFIAKKEQNVEQELKDYLDKTYEKIVPAHVREYVESKDAQAQQPQQTSDADQTPAPGGRPARQSRRQREQAAAESALTPEPQGEGQEPAEEETQGMNMSM